MFLQHPSSKITTQVIFIDPKHFKHFNHPNFLLFVILVIKFKTWFWSRLQIQIWIATKKKNQFLLGPPPVAHPNMRKSTLKLLKYAYSRLQRRKLSCTDRGSSGLQICKVNLVLDCRVKPSEVISRMICLRPPSIRPSLLARVSVCIHVYCISYLLHRSHYLGGADLCNIKSMSAGSHSHNPNKSWQLLRQRQMLALVPSEPFPSHPPSI